MLTQYKKKVAAILSLSTLLLSSSYLPVQAKPTIRQGKPIKPISTRTVGVYQQAEKELSPSLYVVYRIVDRLARANKLDERPWRVAIDDKYEINANQSDVNRIGVYNGLIDQLAGDSSALACVIGHEMAHSIKRHQAVGPAQQAALIKKIENEAIEEAKQEVRGARTQSIVSGIGGLVLGSVLGGRTGEIGGGLIVGVGNQRVQQLPKRLEKIKNKKVEELKQRITEQNRQQEFEADTEGYFYIAKAGFEPEGCLRVMEILARTSGADLGSNTHPPTPERIEALKALMQKYPAAPLAAEGKARINTTQPLTYEPSKDGVALRINSRRGGSSQNDLDRLFGQ